MDLDIVLAQIGALEIELARDMQPLRRIVEALAAGGFNFREVRVEWNYDYSSEGWVRATFPKDAICVFTVDADFKSIVTAEAGGAFVVEAQDDTADEDDERDWIRTRSEEDAAAFVCERVEEYVNRTAGQR